MARIIITVTSTKDRDVKMNGWSHSHRSGETKPRPDSQVSVSDDDVEVALRDSFKHVADIVRFSSKLSSRSLDKAALKKRMSLDDSYSIDSDEETVEEWFDEIVEKLLGVKFLPHEWKGEIFRDSSNG